MQVVERSRSQSRVGNPVQNGDDYLTEETVITEDTVIPAKAGIQ